ncbi:hypothetical protein [Phormidesmis sp. 146-33]
MSNWKVTDMSKSLKLPCKRYLLVSMLLAFFLGINKSLLFKRFLSYGRALKIQSWLLHLWQMEQKQLCAVTFRVLEHCFRSGEIDLDEDVLEYFKDLKAMEAEGRYNEVLHQLYVPRNKSHEEGGKCTVPRHD